MSNWQPGDFLYAAPSGCTNEMITIRPEIEDHTFCCQEVEWHGSSDAMHWSAEPPNPVYFKCHYCQDDHGAECPRVELHYLTLVNYYGSEQPYEVRSARRAERARKQPPPARRQAGS